MDAARFAQGLTYDQYKAQMTRNRDRVEANEKAVAIDPRDVAYFKTLEPLKVMVLVEDWRGDVIANLPVLGVLAREVGTLDVRCFLKDKNMDLMERYLNHGRHESIPVLAFFDEKWNEVGVFIERPTSVTEKRETDRLAVYASKKEYGSASDSMDKLPESVRMELQAALTKARSDIKPWADRQLVMAIRDAVARAPQQGDRVRDPGNH